MRRKRLKAEVGAGPACEKKKNPDDLESADAPVWKSVGAWSRRGCHSPLAVPDHSLGPVGFYRLNCALRTNTFGFAVRV